MNNETQRLARRDPTAGERLILSKLDEFGVLVYLERSGCAAGI